MKKIITKKEEEKYCDICGELVGYNNRKDENIDLCYNHQDVYELIHKIFKNLVVTNEFKSFMDKIIEETTGLYENVILQNIKELHEKNEKLKKYVEEKGGKNMETKNS